MLNESGLWHADAIERQLAHAEKDNIRRAYARAEFWEERVRMMTWWADKCDEMRRGGAVVALVGLGWSAPVLSEPRQRIVREHRVEEAWAGRLLAARTSGS